MNILFSQLSAPILVIAAPAGQSAPLLTASAALPDVLNVRHLSGVGELEQAIIERNWSLLICIREGLAVKTQDVLRLTENTAPPIPVMFVANEAALQKMLDSLREHMEARTEQIYLDAEAVVRESSDWARMAMNASRMGRWRHDLITNTAELDARGREHYGFTEGPVSLERTLQAIHPDDVHRLTDAFKAAVDPTGDGRCETEYRVIHPDGSIHWLAITVQTYFEGEGEARRAVVGFGTTQDITERKAAEVTLRQNEEWLRLAFNASSLDKWRHDLIEDAIELDARGKEHYGIDEDRIPISRVLQVVHPDDVQRLANEVGAALAPTGSGKYETEYRVIHPDGSIRWLAIQVQVNFEGQGETRRPTLGFGTSQDITERKAAETALRQSEEWSRLAFNATSLGKWRHDLASDMVLFDERGQRHFDIDQAEVPLSRIVERVHPEDREFLQREIAKVLDPTLGERNATEYRVVHGDGSIRWLSVHVQAHYESNDRSKGPIFLFGTTQDISQRKADEAALRQSKERLSLFIEYAPAAIAMLDREMRYLAVSRRWLSDYHLTKQDIIGRSHYEIFPDLPEAWKQVHRRCLAGAVEKADADPFPRYDGTLDWVRWEIHPWRDAAGNVGGILLFSEVITAQKEAEDALQEAYELLEQRVLERTEELRASEARYRLLAENVSDVIVKLTPDGTRTYVTPSVFNMVGYRPEELVNRKAWEVIHPDDLPNSRAQFQNALRAGKTHFQVTQRIRHKDGHYIWVEMTNSIVRDPGSGTPLEIIGVVHDISERRKSEMELMSLSQRLQLATEIGAIGVWDWDLPSDQLIWDEQMYRLYGVRYQQKDVTAAELWSRQLLVEEDFSRMQEEVAEALTGEKPLDTVFRIQHQDGSLRHIKVRAVALREGEAEPTRMIGVNWDITLLKQAEENLRWALKKEQDLGALKSRFVSMASHEFRTPLTSILATTETLMRYRERMTEAQIDERLERIREQVDHMSGIMEDVLQMSRIQAGRVEFKPVQGDLKAFCNDIIQEFATQPDHDGRLIESLPDSPIALAFDVRLMRQVLSNLISNALKYSDRDKSVGVELAQGDGTVTLRVRDEGIGIPPEDLEHLFEPFHRATNATTISGTGLGLSIVRQAVEMHGGTIRVESAVNVGTTFTVQFPASLP